MATTIVYLKLKVALDHDNALDSQEICDALGYNSDYDISLLDDNGNEQVYDTEILSASALLED